MRPSGGAGSVAGIPPDLDRSCRSKAAGSPTTDLNDLYPALINRNNRLKNLLQLRTPDALSATRNACCRKLSMRCSTTAGMVGPYRRRRRSLSRWPTMLKGKQVASSEFARQTSGLLRAGQLHCHRTGTQVHQFGLPKKMALVLFDHSSSAAWRDGLWCTPSGPPKKLIERHHQNLDILERSSKGHPILLNRAPTLHRLRSRRSSRTH